MIKAIFHKRHARCTQDELLTSGSEGITVNVEYSHDFDGLQKAAVFTNGETSIDILNPTDSVTIPWEVLSKVGKRVKMGVYAYNTDGIVIPTVYADLGMVQRGADPNLDPNANPTLPVWAEIEEDIDELDNRVTELEQQGGGGFDIHGLTEADTIANDDEIPFHSIEDGEKRKITWSTIKGALKSYFDGIYLTATALVGYATQAWVQSQGYATESDIPDAYTKSQTDNLLDGKEATLNRLGAVNPSADSIATDKYYSASAVSAFIDKLVPHYVSAHSWSVGDYCTFGGTVYKCNTPHSNVQWTSAYWDAVPDLSKDIVDTYALKDDLTQKQDTALTATVTIAVADWEGGTSVTKNVTGVTASNIVICDASDPDVQCTAQGAGTLTFTASATPSAEVTVKVVILP